PPQGAEKPGNAQAQFARWFGGEWKFADRSLLASCQMYWYCHDRKSTRHYWPWKRKDLSFVASFARRRVTRSGATAVYWREFIGSPSIGCAPKFSRSLRRIFIAFSSHGSMPTRSTASKVLKVCN